MIKWLLIFCSFVVAGNSYQHAANVKTDANAITTDQLGNAYLFNQRTLTQYSGKGLKLNTFSEARYGELKSIDASNPLKIVLYYPDFSNVIFLDNSLVQIGAVSLNNLGYADVKVIGAANDHHVWFFDEVGSRLMKLDDRGNILQSSEDLRVMLDETIQPNFLLAANNFVYVNDPLRGVFVFDEYGAFSKMIPIKNLTSFQIKKESLVYLENNNLMSHHLLTMAKSQIALPRTSDIVDVKIQKGHIYILGKLQFDIYNF